MTSCGEGFRLRPFTREVCPRCLSEACSSCLRHAVAQREHLQIPQRHRRRSRLVVPSRGLARLDRPPTSRRSRARRSTSLRRFHGAILAGCCRRSTSRPMQALCRAVHAADYQGRAYPADRTVLEALRHLRTGIVSNADYEHRAAWTLDLPVRLHPRLRSRGRLQA